MANLQIKKVNTLPVTLESKTIYIVNSQTDGYAEIHVSDKDGASSYRLPTMTDVENELNTMFSLTASPNKMPAVGIDGKLDNTWVNPLPTITGATLHRSPNEITAMFIYDTTKDSDGGAWTDKCQHTSWYNETLCGKWLGQCATESAARAVSGATTSDYFQLTTDGKFYKLNAGSGTTEVFRGNKANFPKIAGIVAETSLSLAPVNGLIIYDLTEPNYPMWMVFPQTASGNVYSDFIRWYRAVMTIAALNGYIGISINPNGGFGLISFPQDFLEKPGNSRLKTIAKRGMPNIFTIGKFGYTNYAFGAGYFTDVKMLVLPKAIVENGIPRPTIVISSGYNGGSGGVYIIHSNKNIVKSTSSIQFDQVVVNKYMIMAGRNGSSTIYYAMNPSNLQASFSLILAVASNPPYFNDVYTAKLKTIPNYKSAMHGNQNNIIYAIQNISNYSRTITSAISTTEQTGWLVGNIKRCCMSDNNSVINLIGTILPSILSPGYIQRLGSETVAVNLVLLGNSVVLAGTGPTGQIYRSVDNGLSFTFVQRLGSETYVWSLLSLGDGIVLAGTGPTGQIYRSVDNGLSFTFVQRLGGEAGVMSILSLGDGIVLAGTAATGQIYRSTDNGLSFTLVYQENSIRETRAMVYLGNGVVLAGTNGACSIYSSTDYGVTWGLRQQLENNTGEIRTLLNLGNGIILAGTNPSGQIYRSIDNGLSFTLVQRLGNETIPLSLVSLGNGVVLAGGSGPTGYIYKSTNSGASFTLMRPHLQSTDNSMYCLLYLGNDTVLVGTGPTGQIYRYTFPVITGTLTKTAVATNADLTAYSGFSNSNYVKEAYSSNLDFGTAEWSMSAWIKIPLANAAIGTILYRGHTGGPYIALTVTAANYLSATAYDGTTTRTVTSVNAYNLDTWVKIRANYRTDGSLSLSVNGVEEATTYGTPLLTLNNANAVLTLGNNYALDAPFPGSLCLVKLSATVPTPDQMAFMFAEESQLFRDNAKCTLPDASGIVDLTYDDETDTWTSVSATYKAEWNGLVRTKSSALTSGTYVKVESRSGIALEAIYDNDYKVNTSLPYRNIKGKLALRNYKTDIAMFDYAGGFTATTTNGSTSITSIASMSIPQETTHYEAVISGTGITTDTQLYNIVGTTGYLSKPATANGTAVQIAFRDFILPVGYTVVEVYSQGVKKQEGTSKDYTRLFDGFRETIRFGTAPGYSAWIQIHALPQT